MTASRAQIECGVVIKSRKVDESATERLRAARTSPRPVRFDYREEREARESVFNDERMVALNDTFLGYAPARKQCIRNTIFGSLGDRLLALATEDRHDFRNLVANGDELTVSCDQPLSAVPDVTSSLYVRHRKSEYLDRPDVEDWLSGP